MSRWSRVLRPALTLTLALLPALARTVPTAIFPQAAAAAGPPTAIVGASVLNVEDGSVIPNAVVLIEGDRIKAVGPAASVTLPADVRTIRMDGKWLAPGCSTCTCISA